MIKKINLTVALFSLVLTGFFLTTAPVRAADFTVVEQVNAPLDTDYQVASPEGEIKVNFLAGSLSDAVIVKMLPLWPQAEIVNLAPWPEGQEPKSDLYLVRLVGPAVGDLSPRPQIIVSYQSDDDYQSIYSYNETAKQFEPIDAVRDGVRHTLTFDLPLGESAQFALFGGASQGRASWYVHSKYKNQFIAASRDYAMGAKLLVTNLDNNKQVTVVVRDYGPKACADWTAKEQRLMGPCQERIMDLSKTAFKVLAPTSQGVINVRVESL